MHAFDVSSVLVILFVGQYSAFNLEEPLFIPRVVFVVSPHNFLHSPFYCINADCNYEHEKMQDTRCSTALSH